ncbi:tetratricopeptide repeat protein [Oryzomonas rubra]|uniref:Tetratricopeptide repeat protein n=1 Tax=Oryzomonas rubra TaxID=2509454 RepID=A0A5A9X7W5_9BACT|nr:tetratricopeptide repeat protein [Oryzomonas rubra]KAA0888289.1 tetratricopeptide repeat protein [Oryzomonas rubra]
MNRGRALPYRFARLMVLAASLSVVLQGTAAAVQWRPLARTARHDVAVDMDSLKLTPLGRVTVWLRFTPLGEPQRKLAAGEYGEKQYRLHLEYYEIDCSEQTDILELIDIIGPDGKRLARMKGGGPLAAIFPGSALDLAAKQVCPSFEDETVSDDEVETPDSNDTAEATTQQVPEEVRTRIAEALQKTQKSPDNQAAWRELGNAYYDGDQPQQAIEAYDRALALAPDDADILNDQGAMYRQSGDFTRALANFERALKIAPNNLESLYNVGYVNAFDLNRMDKAREAWRRYLELDRTSETALQVQGFIERYNK